MNTAFLKQVHQLQVYCNSLSQALPALEEAGRTCPDDELRQRVSEIGQEFGLVDLV